MPPTTPDRRDRIVRAFSQGGVALSAFVIFACGWAAMRTDDWWRIAIYTVLAVGAGLAASYFSRQAR